MSKISFEQYQHPVGQGGFHTARISGGGVEFSWVYDCGSDQGSALTAQISALSGRKFNVLFLSHLDADHVNGVDRLLTTTAGVDEVVLPYLNDLDWVFHVAAAAAQDGLTGNYLELARDPAAWFGARGIKRITYLEGVDEHDLINAPTPDNQNYSGPNGGEDFPRSMAEGEALLIWSEDPINRVEATGDYGRSSVALIPHGTVGMLGGRMSRINWVLAPFVYRPSPSKMAKFERMLSGLFGAGLTAGEYAGAAKTLSGRRKLRMCYDMVWKRHNLHSMALYSGPNRPSAKIRNTAWHGGFVRRQIQPGWISLGDFDASVNVRRMALLSYYSKYSEMVGQVALPHHGSDLSFNTELLDSFPDISSAIVAVGNNAHGHPGAQVSHAVSCRPAISLVRVDEHPWSAYVVRGSV